MTYYITDLTPALKKHRPGWRSGGAHELGGAPAEKLNGMLSIKQPYYHLRPSRVPHSDRPLPALKLRPTGAQASPYRLTRCPDDAEGVPATMSALSVQLCEHLLAPIKIGSIRMRICAVFNAKGKRSSGCSSTYTCCMRKRQTVFEK